MKKAKLVKQLLLECRNAEVAVDVAYGAWDAANKAAAEANHNLRVAIHKNDFPVRILDGYGYILITDQPKRDGVIQRECTISRVEFSTVISDGDKKAQQRTK